MKKILIATATAALLAAPLTSFAQAPGERGGGGGAEAPRGGGGGPAEAPRGAPGGAPPRGEAPRGGAPGGAPPGGVRGGPAGAPPAAERAPERAAPERAAPAERGTERPAAAPAERAPAERAPAERGAEPRAGERGAAPGGPAAGARGAGRHQAITPQQRTEFRGAIRGLGVRPGPRPSFPVTVGRRIPRDYELYALPAPILEFYPEYRGYRFFEYGDEIVVIDPETFEIVDIIPLG